MLSGVRAGAGSLPAAPERAARTAAGGEMLRRFLERLRRKADRGLPRHLREGRRGEDAAYNFLKERGYRIVARNYRAREGRGEIDLVAWDGGELVFIEVKTRKNSDFGAPPDAVDDEKKELLIRTAHEYARRAGAAHDCIRFDIVGVVVEPEQRVELWKNAFSALRRPGGRRRL